MTNQSRGIIEAVRLLNKPPSTVLCILKTVPNAKRNYHGDDLRLLL